MTENVIQKSADQILEELFSTLAEPATLSEKQSDPTSVPTINESSAEKADAVAVIQVQEADIKSVTSEKKKKKKKEKKKSKKKKRKKDDGHDDDKGSREKDKRKEKKKDSSVSDKGPIKERKTKADSDVKGDERTTKQSVKKEDKVEVKPKTKEEANKETKKESTKEVKPETKSNAKDVKKETKTEVKVNVKFDKSRVDDQRRNRTETTKETRRSHPIPRRRNSRSRSPLPRRNFARRSRSRTPPRRKRRPRSRSRSRSPPYHRKRSRSPVPQKRLVSPPKSPRIDKAQLLEFARQNLRRMQETGSLPVGVTLPNPPTEVVSTSTQSTGKTVAELTDYCKHLMADRSGEEDEANGKKDSETTFTRHPFQIKPRSDAIVMNIRNAVALPVRKPEERVVAQAQLKQQFPVSSGQQHLELEWVPVPPPPVTTKESTSSSKIAKAVTAAVAPTPRVSLPIAETPSADIGSIVAKRISSIRKLQENQFDVQARLELEEAESMTQSWATFQHTNPMTGEPMPELIDWSGAPQAWVRKDQFTNAAPVAGGVGMKLLQKMGWQPGEGLGRNKEGTLEPLSLDIKMDKKGLLSKEEMAPFRPTPAVKLIQDFQGKHPVSILHELCTKKHWEPPVFEQVADIGPDHLKHFLFKVAVNGMEYQACLASTTKKDAKAQAAAACLQALGVFFMPV